MTIQINEMSVLHIQAALALWKQIEGMGLSSADEPGALARFIQQNAGLSYIAEEDGQLVGTCLCGCDGRRGYLYHLAVLPQYRRRGLGSALVRTVFRALHKRDIHKCHIMVYTTNHSGLKFWQADGWVRRPEIVLMSKEIEVRDGPAA